MTSDESVEAVAKEVMRLDGRIDLLVNNAGFSVALAGDEESSIVQAQSIFDTNFFGTARMTRAVVPFMRRQGGGRIINIGSLLGFLPMPYRAVYAATKHAIEGYSESAGVVAFVVRRNVRLDAPTTPLPRPSALEERPV